MAEGLITEYAHVGSPIKLERRTNLITNINNFKD